MKQNCDFLSVKCCQADYKHKLKLLSVLFKRSDFFGKVFPYLIISGTSEPGVTSDRRVLTLAVFCIS